MHFIIDSPQSQGSIWPGVNRREETDRLLWTSTSNKYLYMPSTSIPCTSGDTHSLSGKCLWVYLMKTSLCIITRLFTVEQLIKFQSQCQPRSLYWGTRWQGFVQIIKKKSQDTKSLICRNIIFTSQRQLRQDMGNPQDRPHWKVRGSESFSSRCCIQRDKVCKVNVARNVHFAEIRTELKYCEKLWKFPKRLHS